MTIEKDAYLTSASQAANKRVFSTRNRTAKFGAVAGAPTLALLTPVAYDKVNSVHRAWGDPVNEVQTVTIDGTGGTWTPKMFGVAVAAALQWNASAATVQAAFEALPGVGAGNVVVTLLSLVYTFTFTGALTGKALPLIDGSVDSLTGGAGTSTAARVTAGVDDDRWRIIGFLWPTTRVLSATLETLGVIMTAGRLNALDVALPSGQTQGLLTAALRGDFPYGSLAAKGFEIEGLALAH